MSEREYPRWVHRDGHPKDSVVAEDATEEAAILGRWGLIDSPRPASANPLVPTLSAAAIEQVERIEPARKGGWPKGKPRAPRAAVN